MSRIYDSGRGIAPSTHVLAIGVGKYPFLLGGNERLAAYPLGLKQLESPPISLKALIDWFLAPTLDAGNIGFYNDQAPLGTIHALASANNPVMVTVPNTTVELDAATKNNIESAFDSWLECLKSNDANIGVFYFCGHGVMVTNHYLLSEDFGVDNHRPWEKAFDISDTIRSVEREFKGALYFFIDACREVSREVALSIGGDPQPLMSVNITKSVSRSSLARISATGEGKLAFAPSGSEVSYFSQALLHALSGFAGIKTAGTPVWEVDGETLASAIRKILERGWENAASQVSEQLTQGRSIPLLRLRTSPKVVVEVNYLPENMRDQYELYLKSIGTSTFTHIVQTRENKCLMANVPMGMYSIGAIDPTGVLQSDIRENEDLRPPYFTLALGG